jgi:methionyl aminopeptidase
MTIPLKTPAEQDAMRVAGRAAAALLDHLAPHVRPGATTGDLDRTARAFIDAHPGWRSATVGYTAGGTRPPFPGAICTSVNHVVCHGIPGERVLRPGDILNVDVTVIVDGFHGDSSRMFHVGAPSILGRRLVDAARAAMEAGIAAVRPGATLGDVGHAVQRVAEGAGFSVVREYCGHGIGRAFHEPPQVQHVGRPGEGEPLLPGMCFTIEPMLNAGRPGTLELPDRWTVVTRDHSLSAQWEHTVLVTPDGVEVLTRATGDA